MKSVFDSNPEATRLLVFEDGNCFLPKDRNLAILHKMQTGKDFEEVLKEQEVKEETKPKTKNK
jgi:hypothetical protein